MLDRIQRTLNLSTLKFDELFPISNNQQATPAPLDGLQVDETLNEQTSKTLIINGVNAKSLDFSQNVNDPTVHLMGLGLRPVSRLKKEIQEDLIKFANLVGNRDAKDLMVYLTDEEGKYSSNMYFAYKLQALMEIEEFLKRPEVKRKITLMKKRG